MAGDGYLEGVEELLVRADRRVLRVLAPVPRCVVMALRLLSGGRRLGPGELAAEAEGYGVPCGSAGRALRYLEGLGLASCGAGGCGLTGEGEELAAALGDVVESLRGFLYRVVEGGVGEDDVLAAAATGMASGLGLAESYLEAPGLLPLYLAVHLYVSGLSAAVLAEASRVSAVVQEALERLAGGGG